MVFQKKSFFKNPFAEKLIGFLFILLLLFPLSTQAIEFADQISKAQAGDYFIIQSQKNYLFLLVESNASSIVTFQEINFPKALLNQIRKGEKEWLEASAPCHTSWYRYALDLNQMQLVYIDSLTLDSVFGTEQKKTFFQSFLGLELEPIQDKDRKKVGLPPPPGAGDKRKYWSPVIKFHGEKLDQISSNPYTAIWPKDGSLLAGKQVELYFPNDSEFDLNYFPYWIEVRRAAGQGKIRVIDSGKLSTTP